LGGLTGLFGEVHRKSNHFKLNACLRVCVRERVSGSVWPHFEMLLSAVWPTTKNKFFFGMSTKFKQNRVIIHVNGYHIGGCRTDEGRERFGQRAVKKA
jgi:hypothetical protein